MNYIDENGVYRINMDGDPRPAPAAVEPEMSHVHTVSDEEIAQAEADLAALAARLDALKAR